MGFLSIGKDKAGQDALIVGGHAIPVSLLGVGAAGIGALVVLRARSSGSNVVSTGTPVTSTGATGDSADLASVSDAVSELSSEISAIQSQLGGLQTVPTSPIPPSKPTGPSKLPSPVTTQQPPGSGSNQAGGIIPIHGAPAPWPGSAAGSGATSPKPIAKATPVSGLQRLAAAVIAPKTVANLNPKPSAPKKPSQTTQIVHSVPTSAKDASMSAPAHSPPVVKVNETQLLIAGHLRTQ